MSGSLAPLSPHLSKIGLWSHHRHLESKSSFLPWLPQIPTFSASDPHFSPPHDLGPKQLLGFPSYALNQEQPLNCLNLPSFETHRGKWDLFEILPEDVLSNSSPPTSFSLLLTTYLKMLRGPTALKTAHMFTWPGEWRVHLDSRCLPALPKVGSPRWCGRSLD